MLKGIILNIVVQICKYNYLHSNQNILIFSRMQSIMQSFQGGAGGVGAAAGGPAGGAGMESLLQM